MPLSKGPSNQLEYFQTYSSIIFVFSESLRSNFGEEEQKVMAKLMARILDQHENELILVIALRELRYVPSPAISLHLFPSLAILSRETRLISHL